ncbi:MAG: hypothetical protein ACP5E3_16505 [Bacteroidales bacterium]
MKTNRRNFIKVTGMGAAFFGINGIREAYADKVGPEDWKSYFPNPPKVYDRLDQGMFETVVPEDRFGQTFMLTSTTDKYVPNPGMGYQVYAYEESGTPDIPGISEMEAIESLFHLPFCDVVYMRTDWRMIQQRPGKLDLPEMWKYSVKLAKDLGKRVSFRIQLGNTAGSVPAVPKFVLEKTGGVVDINDGWLKLPHYEHPEFKKYFKEMNRMLADLYDTDPTVECVDFAGYGAWGEWHSKGTSSFPDPLTASETLCWMIREQRDAWKMTPLVMAAHGGSSYIRLKDVIAEAMKGDCWWRRDNVGLYIKPSDVYMLTNHPSWQANIIEDGRFRDHRLATPEEIEDISGQHIRDHLMMNAVDLNAHYWALWQHADNINKYREKYERGFQILDRKLGYRVRPTLIWVDTTKEPHAILLAIKNDGCAPPPGILRIYISDEEKTFKVGGGLDPGLPSPDGLRICRIPLPQSLKLKSRVIDYDATSISMDLSLRLSAELEFYGNRYPVRWACAEPLNSDGSLTIRKTRGLELS